MADSRGSTSIRSAMHAGKHASLPPRIPFPGVSSAHVDYIPGSTIGSRVVRKPKENFTHHQRTSSEGLVIEEQPSWLDDLLNEPDTPVRKAGHRRSSSDSFAYGDTASLYIIQDEFVKKSPVPLSAWGAQDFNQYLDGWQGSLLPEVNTFNLKNRPWETPFSKIAQSRDNNIAIQSSGLPGTARGMDRVAAVHSEKHYQVEPSQNYLKVSSDRREISPAKQPSETDTKRAKQQFAQRSRVRKLQYIAELEKNIQALQAEGSEVSAELEFLNQQNLIMSMENKALTQRLESLTQEQMIKYLEHEVLERELERLRALYQQQQNPTTPQPQQKQPSAGHRHTSSRDLDTQFGNLSLKPKEPGSGQDNMTRPLHI